jgi:hypothetical protein
VIVFLALICDNFTLMVGDENVKLSAVRLNQPPLSVTEDVAIRATPSLLAIETEAVTGAELNP